MCKNFQVGKAQLHNSYFLVNRHKLRPRHEVGNNGTYNWYFCCGVPRLCFGGYEDVSEGAAFST